MREPKISNMARKALVDVVVFSHNHEAFVEDALRGIFLQECSAEIRIRIHDDASSDKTVKKVQSLLGESPFQSEITVASENKYQFGSGFKYEFAVDTDSDYVAFLDADDYWIDPHKVESQIQFMEANPGVALCHTEFEGVDSRGSTMSFRPPPKFCYPVLPGQTLARGNFIGTLTVLARHSQMPTELPPGFNRLRGVDDYPLWSLVTDGSLIGFVDRKTAGYRLHSGNNYANQREVIKREQNLHAMVYVANSVGEESVKYWLAGIEEFLKPLSLAKRTSRFLKRLFRFLR